MKPHNFRGILTSQLLAVKLLIWNFTIEKRRENLLYLFLLHFHKILNIVKIMKISWSKLFHEVSQIMNTDKINWIMSFARSQLLLWISQTKFHALYKLWLKHVGHAFVMFLSTFSCRHLAPVLIQYINYASMHRLWIWLIGGHQSVLRFPLGCQINIWRQCYFQNFKFLYPNHNVLDFKCKSD